MTEEIKNDIDKLDGMTKIKGKCGYEIIGGCSDLRRLKQENERLKEENERLKKTIEKIKALNLFSLNNSREKIAEINAIINDQKESEG